MTAPREANAELESRRVAEASREAQWQGESFLKALFMGELRLDLVTPYPVESPDRPAFREFYDRLERFLREEVDPVAIDASGEYPEAVIRGLAELGAFGMKIPEEYGGLGLTHPEYVRVMELLGSYDGNVTALLSAHQAIGVPQPVKLFGDEALKRRYLPRCARGAISAFALTEATVGSDPARLATTAEQAPDGSHWVLNGEKLWCTNGTLAELLVVMARNPETERINCFVVETDQEGVAVEHRCHFMGLRALANAVVSFRNVKVPAENLIGEDGAGLRIALTTLNTGRLSLPAATAGTVKMALEICRKWSEAREQWGVAIGKHEAITHKLADMAASAYAMESVAWYVGDLADRPGVDIRLEAAAAKEWNTVRGWNQVDEALQVRGGRGYETERSLAGRGEPPIGIERMLRDSRINRIFEGSSEIMHLFIAREAVDEHLEVAGAFGDPQAKWTERLKALPGMTRFYARWYPTRWIPWSLWNRYGEFGALATHLRFAERASRKLARELFHGMARYQAGLERRQAFLFGAVDIAMELFVLTLAVARARRMEELGDPDAGHALDLADLVARDARRRVRELFRALWRNDDRRRSHLGAAVLRGDQAWLERGTMGLPYDAKDLKPTAMTEIVD